MNIRAVKGTVDLLPGEVEIWQRIESVIRETMTLYNYAEIRTPLFEETSLFKRSIGEDTDIVGKEMYSFEDLGGRSLTLRPEGTASVVRAFIEHSLDQRGLPTKLWYRGPMFRQERPQKGRQRQFHQFGVEMIGSSSPAADVEVMLLFDRIARRLGIEDCVYAINSLGGAESREAYRARLVAFLDTITDRLCDDCKRRRDTNPMRVLDCKAKGCREALHDSGDVPRTRDHLTSDDRAYFDNVVKLLDFAGVRYIIDDSLVRGLDYYTGIVFEMNDAALGAQSALMGGGRYDTLVGALGGADLPAVGFACGLERLVIAIKARTKEAEAGHGPLRVFVVVPEERMVPRAIAYMESIRELGHAADMDFLGRSMKSQMKAAGKSCADYALIIEPEPDQVSVKNLHNAEQTAILFDEFITLL